MSEAQHDATEPGGQTVDAEPTASGTDPVRTGSERVDEVIRAVEELEDRPIEEHVGVFESAQTELRRALDDPGEPDHAADHSQR